MSNLWKARKRPHDSDEDHECKIYEERENTSWGKWVSWVANPWKAWKMSHDVDEDNECFCEKREKGLMNNDEGSRIMKKCDICRSKEKKIVW